MTIRALALTTLAALALSGCPRSPDLVVSSLTSTGPPALGSGGGYEVPAEVVVRNQGTGSASVFKVATEFTGGAIDPTRTFVVAFTVPGQSSPWYPFTSAPLAAGASHTFTGRLVFHPAETGVNVSITATADSCSGDELMPPHCRVQESDEGNNTSSPIAVALP